MRKIGRLGHILTLVVSVGIACVPAAAQDVGEARGTIQMYGWVSSACHIYAPLLRTERDAVARLIVELKHVCSGQGGHRIWLDAATGVDSLGIGDSPQFAQPPLGPILLAAAIKPALGSCTLVVVLDRQVLAPHLTLRVQPIL